MSTHKYSPESLMMNHGYEPFKFKGAIKPPVFQSSTFVFNTAEEGKAFFELTYGLRDPGRGEIPGYIYSRLNNPNLDLFEKRLCQWDKAESCAAFASGMAAITTSMLELLKPGDLLLYGTPLYGGTEHFVTQLLPEIGVDVMAFKAGHSFAETRNLLMQSGKAEKLRMIFVESPANPTNDIFDIGLCRRLADTFSTDNKTVKVAVDNTYMGPLWSHPLAHGADIVIYSATKYIGGHSDLIAGAVLGNSEVIDRIRGLRTFLGNMASPHTCSLLLRSLETMKIRMEQQLKNAEKVAAFLEKHHKVEKVYYLGLIEPGSSVYNLYKKQYSAPGAMIAFDIKGGESQAFQFLNNLKLFKLAVSLGSTESLAQHPSSMTHAGIDPEKREFMGITDQMIRLSIGIENIDDIISDLDTALKRVMIYSETTEGIYLDESYY